MKRLPLPRVYHLPQHRLRWLCLLLFLSIVISGIACSGEPSSLALESKHQKIISEAETQTGHEENTEPTEEPKLPKNAPMHTTFSLEEIERIHLLNKQDEFKILQTRELVFNAETKTHELEGQTTLKLSVHPDILATHEQVKLTVHEYSQKQELQGRDDIKGLATGYIIESSEIDVKRSVTAILQHRSFIGKCLNESLHRFVLQELDFARSIHTNRVERILQTLPAKITAESLGYYPEYFYGFEPHKQEATPQLPTQKRLVLRVFERKEAWWEEAVPVSGTASPENPEQGEANKTGSRVCQPTPIAPPQSDYYYIWWDKKVTAQFEESDSANKEAPNVKQRLLFEVHGWNNYRTMMRSVGIHVDINTFAQKLILIRDKLLNTGLKLPYASDDGFKMRAIRMEFLQSAPLNDGACATTQVKAMGSYKNWKFAYQNKRILFYLAPHPNNRVTASARNWDCYTHSKRKKQSFATIAHEIAHTFEYVNGERRIRELYQTILQNSQANRNLTPFQTFRKLQMPSWISEMFGRWTEDFLFDTEPKLQRIHSKDPLLLEGLVSLYGFSFFTTFGMDAETSTLPRFVLPVTGGYNSSSFLTYFLERNQVSGEVQKDSISAVFGYLFSGAVANQSPDCSLTTTVDRYCSSSTNTASQMFAKIAKHKTMRDTLLDYADKFYTCQLNRTKIGIKDVDGKRESEWTLKSGVDPRSHFWYQFQCKTSTKGHSRITHFRCPGDSWERKNLPRCPNDTLYRSGTVVKLLNERSLQVRHPYFWDLGSQAQQGKHPRDVVYNKKLTGVNRKGVKVQAANLDHIKELPISVARSNARYRNRPDTTGQTQDNATMYRMRLLYGAFSKVSIDIEDLRTNEAITNIKSAFKKDPKSAHDYQLHFDLKMPLAPPRNRVYSLQRWHPKNRAT